MFILDVCFVLLHEESYLFNNLGNSEFIHHEYIDLSICLCMMIQSFILIDISIRIIVHIMHNLNNVEQQLFETNEQALCEYYTIEDWREFQITQWYNIYSH